MAFLGANHATPVIQFSRFCPADQSWQQPGTTTFRHHITLSGDRRHFRRLTGNPHITQQRHIHAITGSCTIERTDHRFVQTPHNIDGSITKVKEGFRAIVATLVTAANATLADINQVQAGTKAFAGTGEDNTANLRVLVGLDHFHRQFSQHFVTDGIQACGSVECHDNNVLTLFD